MMDWMIVAQAQGQSPLGALGAFMPMVLILVVFYLVLFLPMRKKQKALESLIDSLKKGDRVVTNGGLYGEVVKTDDQAQTLILKLADNVKVKVAKRAIAGLEGGQEDKGDGR
jgi:preprotein translocase subunit YajC